MAKREELTQEQLDQLIEDASYLQDEAEALKYVIDEVPYDEAPPDNESIVEMLLLIDHAQLSYYRPILTQAVEDHRPIKIGDIPHYENTFEFDEEKAADIEKVLSRIAKHRAGLVNQIKKTPLIDWETILYNDDLELRLYDFIQGMIRFERGKLKEIADLVMIFKEEEKTQRELKRRAEDTQHEHQN